MNTIQVKITDRATPQVAAIITRLKARTRINRTIADELKSEVADYTLQDSFGRHATADALGARHTGFRADAAKLVQKGTPKVTDQGGSIALPGAHFARAFGNVHIAPRNGSRFLTIPMSAESYGKRMGKGASSRWPGGFFLRSKDKRRLFFAVPNGNGGVNLLYNLVPSVDQKQDRTLLPTDQALTEAAIRGADKGVNQIIKEIQAGGPKT
jgi:hypothetical protein